MSFTLRAAAFSAAALALTACGEPAAQTGAGEVNVFTARHYASDDAVYAAFTEQTGIAVNVIEAPGDLLIERVRTDGERSQADVVITVDAGRLWRAEQAGLFQAAPELQDALADVPENLRHPEGDWFGFAARVRGIAYAADRVDPADIQDFTALADEAWRGRICVRSSNNVYNQSLLAGLIEAEGAEAAESWAAGIVANMARPPQGGDTDQIRAIATGQCDVAIVNHYYLARLERSQDPADMEAAEAVDLVIADLAGRGAHMNISGAGLAAGAPNRDNAVALLEFLLSDDAQRAFAELTNEYPVIEGVTYDNAVLDGWGAVEADPLNVNALGENAGEAQRIFDRVGWP
ncbi:MAG: extracellular solute-binding protein [Alphaproteobacteria bacterium]|nr:extracellular solute-binding protein [Alphaproteobacteria bacterium]